MDNGIQIPIDEDDYMAITRQMAKDSHKWLWVKAKPKNDDTVVKTSKITAIIKAPIYDKKQVAEIIEKNTGSYPVFPDTPMPEYPYHITCEKL